MPANKQDFAASLREVAERPPRRASSTQPGEQLIDFVEGRLSVDEEEHLRNELATDAEALEVIRDLNAFPDVALRPEEAHRADDVVPDWQSMKARLDEIPTEPAPSVTSFPSRQAEDQEQPPSRWRRLAIAALALIALTPWLLVHSQRQTISTLMDRVAQLEAPKIQNAVFSLRPLDRVVRDPRTQRFEVPTGAERVRLVLNVLDPEDVTRYDLLVMREDSSEVLWRGVDARPDEIGLFHLDLPRPLVPTGTYRIEIDGRTSEDTTVEVARFRFALDDAEEP